MKLQNLFVATAILATTVVGGTTFAAEEGVKTLGTTNSVEVTPGIKTITSAPSFGFENAELKADMGTINLAQAETPEEGETKAANANVVTFEDFSGGNAFTLTATQDTGFKTEALETPINTTMKYTGLELTSQNGMEPKDLTVETALEFNGGTATTVVSSKDFKSAGAWTLAIGSATLEIGKNQAIPAGDYTSTVNWNIADATYGTVK